ncbi:MAG: hypothetical protein IKU02_02280 [Bacteroidaceae bacterium]|nr:hypothetical protein [Bacteroidaceae bacterium]
MKRILLAIILLLFAFSPIQLLKAQSLVGRVYHNANIMAEKMNEAISKAIPEAKAEAIAKQEKEKGRKLTDAEKAEVNKKMDEAQAKANAAMKGIKTAITVEFKSETQAVMKTDMQVNEEALKQAGVPWAKRKALKAAIAIMPTTEKTSYMVKGNLVIMSPTDEPDTLRLSNDGKYLYGKFDKDFEVKLTRTK